MTNGQEKVSPCNRSFEADEQSGAIRRGAGGAKGGDRGECEPAKHAPGPEPGERVTGAGTHTASRKAKEGGTGGARKIAGSARGRDRQQKGELHLGRRRPVFF